MKKIALFCIASVFSSTCLAVSSYTGTNTKGTVVIENVEVNGLPIFDNVTMDLDLQAGTFKIVNIQTKNKTVFTSPIENFTEDGFNVGLLGCAKISGSNDVDCYLQIVNTLLDRNLTVNGDTAIAPSLLTDNIGNTYRPAYVKNYNIKNDFTANLLLAQGIATRVIIGYKNIDVRATSMSTFLPGFFGNKAFNVTFKDIKF